MSMQILSVPDNKKRSFRIGVDIGQYHFIDWRGWRLNWVTETAGEWWEKQQWLKDGGWSQDGNSSDVSRKRAKR
jgi:hypothetical protein